jgi:hypothetical protein
LGLTGSDYAAHAVRGTSSTSQPPPGTSESSQSCCPYGLSTFFRHSEITARGIKVRRVGGDTAIIHTRWKLAGQIGKAGETLEDRFAIMVFFAQRLANGWTVLAAHNTDVIPGMETIAAKDGSAFAVNYRDGE